MAILVIFTGDITKEQYDALRKEVHWEDMLPPGVIFHAAGFDDAGHIHVSDVWESQEALDAFVGGRLIPGFQKLKVNPPKVDVYPAHNINAYSSVTKYILRG